LQRVECKLYIKSNRDEGSIPFTRSIDYEALTSCVAKM
jgi:hypothetical protein